jgi:hypothetical protein
MLAEQVPGRGERNTPFLGQICTETPAYRVVGAGVDQIRFVLSLSGDSARFCESLTEHDYRPRGMPSLRMVGAWKFDSYGRTFVHFLGEDGPRLFYHRDSASLHVDLHFRELESVPRAVRAAELLVDRLALQGVDSLFPARVARADFTGDVIFASAAYFRYVFSAFGAMLPGHGRVVDPFKSSTLYLSASRSSRSKRLGRVYDRGSERAAVAGWSIPHERYMRIEAERLWDGDRPLLRDLSSQVARSTFLDRFAAVGHGTVLLKGGLTDALLRLRDKGEILAKDYEQLYTFLDHVRMGLADQVYSKDTFGRRARKVRALGLEVPPPSGSVEDEAIGAGLDVRALVSEIAEAL